MATRTIQAMIVSEDFDEAEARYDIEIKLDGIHDGYFEKIKDAKVVDAYVWGGRVFVELEIQGEVADPLGRTMEEYLQ